MRHLLRHFQAFETMEISRAESAGDKFIHYIPWWDLRVPTESGVQLGGNGIQSEPVWLDEVCSCCSLPPLTAYTWLLHSRNHVQHALFSGPVDGGEKKGNNAVSRAIFALLNYELDGKVY